MGTGMDDGAADRAASDGRLCVRLMKTGYARTIAPTARAATTRAQTERLDDPECTCLVDAQQVRTVGCVSLLGGVRRRLRGCRDCLVGFAEPPSFAGRCRRQCPPAVVRETPARGLDGCESGYSTRTRARASQSAERQRRVPGAQGVRTMTRWLGTQPDGQARILGDGPHESDDRHQDQEEARHSTGLERTVRSPLE